MKLTSDCCDCFAGLATKSRVEIVNLLQKKEKMTVSEIVNNFKLTQPTITHHLRYLKEAGLVSSAKKGRQVYYFISQKCKEGRCGLFS
ncbi:ArsR/SmtB family transcription factor [Patescibacteria group bacterium]